MILMFNEKYKSNKYQDLIFQFEYKMDKVQLVLHPQGIALTFLKFNSWSLGASFIYITSTKAILVRKKLSFMHTKRYNTLFKRWVQFHVYRKYENTNKRDSRLEEHLRL